MGYEAGGEPRVRSAESHIQARLSMSTTLLLWIAAKTTVLLLGATTKSQDDNPTASPSCGDRFPGIAGTSRINIGSETTFSTGTIRLIFLVLRLFVSGLLQAELFADGTNPLVNMTGIGVKL